MEFLVNERPRLRMIDIAGDKQRFDRQIEGKIASTAGLSGLVYDGVVMKY